MVQLAFGCATSPPRTSPGQSIPPPLDVEARLPGVLASTLSLHYPGGHAPPPPPVSRCTPPRQLQPLARRMSRLVPAGAFEATEWEVKLAVLDRLHLQRHVEKRGVCNLWNRLQACLMVAKLAHHARLAGDDNVGTGNPRNSLEVHRHVHVGFFEGCRYVLFIGQREPNIVEKWQCNGNPSNYQDYC